MKIIQLFYKSSVFYAFNIVLLISNLGLGKADITGQWNFTNGLQAEIGQDLEWNYEQGEAEFGKASKFKVKTLNNEDPMVMSFPNSDPETEFSGLDVYHGGEPNGGSDWLLNQYTLVMDLFYSVRSYNKPRALIALNDFEGAQFQVGTSNGIGSRSFHGKLRPNQWHRVALTVDHVLGEANYFVDGNLVGTEAIGKATDDNGRLAMEDVFHLFNHSSESFGGFISSLQFRDEAVPASVIEELGQANAAGIPSEPPSKPYLVSMTPKPTPFRRPVPTDILPNTVIQSTWKDGKAAMREDTVKLHLNGKPLDVSAKRSDDTVIISAIPENLLEPLGNYEVLVKFNDSNDESHSKQWRFTVTNFQKIQSDIALPIASGREPGFLVRSAQATAEAAIRHDYNRAIHQLEDILTDIEGNAVENVAYPPEDGREFDLIELIDFQKEGSIFGHFEMDDYFPGIPGEEDHDTNFSTEVLAYLALKAGTHRLGITVHVAKPDQNDEDRFKVFVGGNARDRFSQEIGSFELTLLGFREGPNDTTFDFTVEKDGLYPFRIIYWNKSRNAALEFYSVDLETGERVLINDTENNDSIRAFSSVGQVRRPYVAMASPPPNTSGNSKDTPISIVLSDDETKVDASSIKMYVNRRRAKPSITRAGRHTFVEHLPEHKSLSELDYDVKLTFKDSTETTLTREWSFSVDARDKMEITGYWNFSSKLKAVIGSDLVYLDGESGATASATEFGITTDFGVNDISGKPASVMKVGHVGSNANFGYLMEHGVSANGGGNRANQYTIIFDVLFSGSGNGWAAVLNMDSQGDGDVFWRRGDGGLGQGGGGYEPDDPELKVNQGQWHRVVLAVDLAKGVYEKYVDGQYHSTQDNAGLDGRQSMKPSAWLFNDNDGENGEVYVAAIQVRNGKVSQEEAKELGGASAMGIPMPTPVRGLWNFDEGDLSATLGQTLDYLDGAKGATAGATDFGTTESFGIDGIDGKPANIMKIGHVGSNQNFGYLMTHNIEPNGGGKQVNQFSLAFDLYFSGKGSGWASLANFDNKGDGDIFWRRGDGGLGQGGGGYEPDDPEVKINTRQWHRIVLAFDLAASSYKKYVDGLYHSSQSNGGLDGRQSMGPTTWLFNDNDGENGEVYVSSIAVYERELTAEEALAMGSPKSSGIPTNLESAPDPQVIPTISLTRQADGLITIEFKGNLQSSANANGPWKDIDATNPATISGSETRQFYRTRN